MAKFQNYTYVWCQLLQKGYFKTNQNKTKQTIFNMYNGLSSFISSKLQCDQN